MRRATMSRLLAVSWLTLLSDPNAPLAEATAARAPVVRTLAVPRTDGSVRFAVVGDMGRDSQGRVDVAQQVTAFHGLFPFTFVLLLGDNVYGSDNSAGMRSKFEAPYRSLLDAGVVFRAVLGNHDNPTERFYEPFNMGGERYYTFQESGGEPANVTEGGVQFFALDTGYLDQPQLDWLAKELSSSSSDWKIAFFHHPLYSSGGTHGSALESRAVLEPLFVRHGVSAAFSGHDHIYERVKPQEGGIVHWVSGGGGSLRTGDLRATDLTARGFDRDYHFMIVEISGDELYFQAITRTGATIESGVLHRPGAPVAAAIGSEPVPASGAVPGHPPAAAPLPGPYAGGEIPRFRGETP